MILVDIFDRETGTATKEEAHRRALLHRAFSVFLYSVRNGKPSMLIHRRAFGKYHSGGLWTNACCSHPRQGEDLAASAGRRLGEELGITADLQELFVFPYFHRFDEACAEFEIDHVFLGRFDGSEIPFDPQEVAELRWVSLEELTDSILNEPDRYTPWFMIAAPAVIRAVYQACTPGTTPEV